MQTLLPGSSPASYVPNELNQYTSVDNGNPLYYDDNGNLTAYDGWSYGYDAHNRLVSATQAGTSLDLDYDPNGRLSSTTLNSSTTEYVYSGDQLIGELDPAGNPVNLYVYAPGSDIPIARFSGSNGLNDMQYLRADERGSIVVETDGTLVLESHQYDVYGVPLEASDSLFRYTGQIQLKGTELYHYKARAYHPGLGRFLQTDPIGYDDGMNMYAYVGNDPVNAVDPSGMVNTERFASRSGKFINSKQLSNTDISAKEKNDEALEQAATAASGAAAAASQVPRGTLGFTKVTKQFRFYEWAANGRYIGNQYLRTVHLNLVPSVKLLGLGASGLTLAANMEGLMAGDPVTVIDTVTLLGASAAFGPAGGFVIGVAATNGEPVYAWAVEGLIRGQDQTGFHRTNMQSDKLIDSLQDSIVGWKYK